MRNAVWLQTDRSVDDFTVIRDEKLCAALSTNGAERNKPQWQALGVALTYWPIQTANTDLKATVLVITEKMVTQMEMEWRAPRGPRWIG